MFAWPTTARAGDGRARARAEWKSQPQTSLIDPPDGRPPPLTPGTGSDGGRRADFGGAALNGPEDFTRLGAMHFARFGSTLPVLYNSGIDITQAGLCRDPIRAHPRLPHHPDRSTSACVSTSPAVHG